MKKTRTFFVHRLVAKHFIDNPDNLPIIHHKDGNPTNNLIDNLMWSTNAYNIKEGYKNKNNFWLKDTKYKEIRNCIICKSSRIN